MRIFGKRGVKTHLQTGTFYCPNCASTQVYHLKRITSFKALFSLPLVKAQQRKAFVECQQCLGTFIPRVLDYDPKVQDRIFLSLYEEALTRSLALIILIDAGDAFQKKMLMLSMLKKFGNQDLDLEDLERLLKRERKKPDSAFDMLKKIRPQLNEHGRHLILKCALSMATIEGALTEFELLIITKFAETLGISSTELVGLLNNDFSRSAA